MILHLVKCEICEKQFTFNPMEHPARRDAPPGWLVLFDAKDMQAQEGWHFCSRRCLCDWTTKAVIPIEVDPALPGNVIRMGNAVLENIKED